MGITKKKKSAQDIPTRSERAVQSRKRKKNRHTFGKILALIQIVLSVVFFAVLLMLNILPMKYLVLVVGLFVFLDAFALGSQYTRSAHMIGKIDCVFMIILLLAANVYLIRANSTLLSITDNEYKIDRIEIVVLNDDSAQTLQDAANYDFGARIVADEAGGMAENEIYIWISPSHPNYSALISSVHTDMEIYFID